MSAKRRRGRATALRRRDALHTYTMHFGPNMTPMVDIVMVILIFFMATAAFMGNEWFLRAAIPFEAGRGTSLNKPNDPLALPLKPLEILLGVTPEGVTTVTFLDLQNASLDQFLARIAQFPRNDTTAELEVVIRPDPRVPYPDVIRVHAACDAAGIYKVGITVPRGAPAGGAAGSGAGSP
jgi:biopolymer transport protein ExbD